MTFQIAFTDTTIGVYGVQSDKDTSLAYGEMIYLGTDNPQVGIATFKQNRIEILKLCMQSKLINFW